MSRIAYVFPLVALSLVTGCTITLVDGPRGSEWDPNDSEDFTTSTGSGWNDGTGGSTASGMGTGSTGTGMSTVSTGSGMGTGGGGSSGSGTTPTCVAASGTGRTAAECNAIPSASVSCGGSASLAYGTCKRGYALFAPGQAEALASCLAKIPASNACATEPVQSCVDKMYADACTNPNVGADCNEWASVCGQANQSFDAARCSADLNPFSAPAIDEFVDCMNAATGTCQNSYDTCFDKAFAL